MRLAPRRHLVLTFLVLQIIRLPLLMLPFVASSISTAMIALDRMSKFLSAEELEDPYIVDPNSEYAVSVDADFTWEPVKKPEAEKKGPAAPAADEKKGEVEPKKGEKKGKKKGKKGEEEEKLELPTTAIEVKEEEEKAAEPEDPPFEVKDVKVNIAKGSFVGIVGKIGSGKVSKALNWE